LVGWLVGWLVDWLVGWSVGRLVGWSVGRLVGWSVGQLVGWSVGRLVGWSVGRLVGWLVSQLVNLWKTSVYASQERSTQTLQSCSLFSKYHNVSSYTSKCNLTYVRKKSIAPPAPIATLFTNSLQYYEQIYYTEYYTDRKINMKRID